ncbi:hypothetical protein QA584_22735 [Anaerocolumna sp. AGMB13025]|uniref:hypothetical protein n=1 Tax=Anaerocolumna sp. AGMB13025 TaxID=3039116 RepID=UPI00241D207D|nr:hypothetical protein [Anaerocolumna sp. AGMB13025]WFR56401.1 hypothetical protein QA584_22735 [Anaerocolumna sp. AGMB13025]
MKNVSEWVDTTNNIANQLQHAASLRLNEKVLQAQAEKKGYDQACEDFARAMRQEFSVNQGKGGE